ncbi:hypothetical protein [Occallatibacter riparius]|uniref:N-acetyltransferase domain-containing protein n=1 Tax=Occallatibacter riparius TaxID=1002689 RepID=A0A9J7BY09_9BACT|nr:hypothetical protein [Occallatibacter riparius]UWZ86930.1 hypothetical protein MOP44_13500 [Occallatibacter riparius]
MKRDLIEVEGLEIRITGRRLRTAQLEGDFYQFLKDPESVIAALRATPDRPDLFTFMQSLADVTPKYKYPMEWDNMAVISVSTFDHWMNHQISAKPRNQMRLAAKRGVELREVPFSEELVRGIKRIYDETPVRQGRMFPHYKEDFESVYAAEATFLDRAIFLGAYLGEELIGFVKLVADEDWNQVGMMNILSLISQRDKAPNNALVAEAVRTCANRGIPNLVYFRFAQGKRQRGGVIDFKLHCGFRRVDVPRYYVPLTPWGRAALRLGLHHRLRDRLPEGLSEKLKELQKRWHEQRTLEKASIGKINPWRLFD